MREQMRPANNALRLISLIYISQESLNFDWRRQPTLPELFATFRLDGRHAMATAPNKRVFPRRSSQMDCLALNALQTMQTRAADLKGYFCNPGASPCLYCFSNVISLLVLLRYWFEFASNGRLAAAWVQDRKGCAESAIASAHVLNQNSALAAASFHHSEVGASKPVIENVFHTTS